MKKFDHKKVAGFGIVALAALAAMGAAPAFDRQVRLESKDGRRAYYRTTLDGNDRVRLIRRLSDRPCIEGRTWGYNRSGVWVDDGCRAVFEIDNRSGGSIGNDPDWGRNGPGNSDWGHSRGRGRGRNDDWGRDDRYDRYGRAVRVTLESHGRESDSYRADNITSARLVRQLSDAPCREGRTWGYSSRQVWVRDGCRAIFDVYRR
jgi:hypothetical protein